MSRGEEVNDFLAAVIAAALFGFSTVELISRIARMESRRAARRAEIAASAAAGDRLSQHVADYEHVPHRQEVKEEAKPRPRSRSSGTRKKASE